MKEGNEYLTILINNKSISEEHIKGQGRQKRIHAHSIPKLKHLLLDKSVITMAKLLQSPITEVTEVYKDYKNFQFVFFFLYFWELAKLKVSLKLCHLIVHLEFILQPKEQEATVKSIDVLRGQGIFTTIEAFNSAWQEALNTTALYYSISVDKASTLVNVTNQTQNETLQSDENSLNQTDNQTSTNQTEE